MCDIGQVPSYLLGCGGIIMQDIFSVFAPEMTIRFTQKTTRKKKLSLAIVSGVIFNFFFFLCVLQLITPLPQQSLSQSSHQGCSG